MLDGQIPAELQLITNKQNARQYCISHILLNNCIRGNCCGLVLSHMQLQCLIAQEKQPLQPEMFSNAHLLLLPTA